MLKSNLIGNKITEARKKVNLSQSQLAERLFISPQAVGKWERGESMPDIVTLNRLAEILGVTLNYFSETAQPTTADSASVEPLTNKPTESPFSVNKRKPDWNMSQMNLVDNDFSKLKNLNEKLSSSNMQKCLFVDSEMSGLLLKNNNVDSCDFSGSNISNSQIQSSNLDNNIFKNCSLKETEFSKSNISKCDFSDADFTKTIFKLSNFGGNTITNVKLNGTSFVEMKIQNIVFGGMLEDCCFENCVFYGVTFQNATLTNTFFKNNKKFKRVKFINCKADKMTYAFLKSNQANIADITLVV